MTTTDAEAVVDAAERRARALVDGDAETLRNLMHPSMQWTTFNGDLFSRDQYIAGNTDGDIVWVSQTLERARVVVVGETAVLTAVVVDEVQRGSDREMFALRLTQTWVRAGGGWQCIAGHAGPRVN